MKDKTILEHLNIALEEAYDLLVDEFEDKVSYLKEVEFISNNENSLEEDLDDIEAYTLPQNLDEAIADVKKYAPTDKLLSVLLVYKYFS